MVLRPPAVAPERLACQRCAISQRPVSALQAWRRVASRAAAACSVVRPRRCRGCTRRATSISLALPSALWRGRRRRRSALLSLALLGSRKPSLGRSTLARLPIAAGHPEQRDGRRRLHRPRLVRPTLQRSAVAPPLLPLSVESPQTRTAQARVPIVSAHDWALVTTRTRLPDGDRPAPAGCGNGERHVAAALGRVLASAAHPSERAHRAQRAAAVRRLGSDSRRRPVAADSDLRQADGTCPVCYTCACRPSVHLLPCTCFCAHDAVACDGTLVCRCHSSNGGSSRRCATSQASPSIEAKALAHSLN
jgi:hypothetical protein